MRKQQETLYSI